MSVMFVLRHDLGTETLNGKSRSISERVSRQSPTLSAEDAIRTPS